MLASQRHTTLARYRLSNAMYPSTTPVSLRIQRWLDNVLVEVVGFTGVTRDWKTLQNPPKEPQMHHNHR